MKELRGTATGMVEASRAQCLTVLEAVDRYPDWYPQVVRSVEVVERDDSGECSRVRAKLHVERGPITRDFDLVMAVLVDEPETVQLSRVTDGRSDQLFDVTWRLSDGHRTRLTLDLLANLDAPRFLPLGGVGDSIAKGFVAAATAAIQSRDAANR